MYRALFRYVPLAVGLLVVSGLVFPRCRQLRMRTRAQAIWAMVILLCCSKFICFKALGGDEFNPDLPAAVIWIWDWLYSGAMLLCALALLTFFLRFRAKAWILPTLAWGLAAWGLYNGLCVPSVREIELAYADLPPELDGYRIVQLSDLHCSCATWRGRTQAVVDIANALQPDLICLTGDFTDGAVGRIAPLAEPLKELRARDGVFACTGNHEYYHDYVSWAMRFYDTAANIRFLSNTCAFPRPGLALAGVPAPAGWGRGDDALPDPRLAFAPATNGEFRILLQHRPGGAAECARELGVRLQLSGHTHGGVAPGLRPIIASINGGFVRGLYALGRSYLYVSPGCGQWGGFPMRLFNASEITVLVLRRMD